MFELQSPEINHISEAFAKAQGEYPKIGKDKEGHNYKYVEMQTLLNAILPVLSKNGLSLWQGTTWIEGKTFLVSFLRHSSGQWFANYTPYLDINTTSRNVHHDFGTATTYLRRYQAMAILGIHGDKDTDADDLEEAEPAPLKELVKPFQQVKIEKITLEQLEMLEYELEGYPDIAQNMMKSLQLETIADLPKEKYLFCIKKIQEHKAIKKLR